MPAANLNERAVLDFLLHRPQGTVQQLADHVALSPSTVGNVCNRLLEKGVIVRGPSVAHGRGRPAATFRAALPGLVAVVHFDGSRVEGALFDHDARHLATCSADLPQIDNLQKAADIVHETAARLLADAAAPRDDLALIVITLNAMRLRGGRHVSSSVLPWVTEDLPGVLRGRLGTQVEVVSASTLIAELAYLDEPDVETMVRFNVGDGVSSHAMLSGRVATGHNHLAGELGHITLDPKGPRCGCGKRGCIEAMMSGPAIRNAAVTALDTTNGANTKSQLAQLDRRTLAGRSVRLAIDHLHHAWQQGDPVARAVMDTALDRIAWALSISLNLLDPDMVRVDGYLLRDRDDWIEQVVERVRPQLLRGEGRDLIIQNARATLLDQQRIAAYRALTESAPAQSLPVSRSLA